MSQQFSPQPQAYPAGMPPPQNFIPTQAQLQGSSNPAQGYPPQSFAPVQAQGYPVGMQPPQNFAPVQGQNPQAYPPSQAQGYSSQNPQAYPPSQGDNSWMPRPPVQNPAPAQNQAIVPRMPTQVTSTVPRSQARRAPIIESYRITSSRGNPWRSLNAVQIGNITIEDKTSGDGKHGYKVMKIPVNGTDYFVVDFPPNMVSGKGIKESKTYPGKWGFSIRLNILDDPIHAELYQKFEEYRLLVIKRMAEQLLVNPGSFPGIYTAPRARIGSSEPPPEVTVQSIMDVLYDSPQIGHLASQSKKKPVDGVYYINLGIYDNTPFNRPIFVNGVMTGSMAPIDQSYLVDAKVTCCLKIAFRGANCARGMSFKLDIHSAVVSNREKGEEGTDVQETLDYLLETGTAVDLESTLKEIDVENQSTNTQLSEDVRRQFTDTLIEQNNGPVINPGTQAKLIQYSGHQEADYSPAASNQISTSYLNRN